MNDHRPRPTPEGQLIRRVRDLAIPKLSIRAAAARIGMSAEQWGYIERGYFPSRGGNAPQPFSPPAATLAKMAHALRINPERLESEGQRPDAAEILREIVREEAPVTPPRPTPPARRSIDFSGGDPEGLRPWQQQVLRELYVPLGIAARFGPGDVPEPSELPGVEDALLSLPLSRLPFTLDHEKAAWSDPALTVSEKIGVIARTRWLVAKITDDEERRSTGLVRRPSPPFGAVTTFSTASRAHLRRATPGGLARLREQARATELTMSGRNDRPKAAGLPGVSPLRGGSFARALPGGSPTGAAAVAHGCPATGRRPVPAVTAADAAPREQDQAVMLASGASVARAKVQSPVLERRALSGPVPPASTVLRIPLRGTRLRRAVDPGASTGPAGLTARARPEARPGARAANLHIVTLRGAIIGRMAKGRVQDRMPVADPRKAEQDLWLAFAHGTMVDLREGNAKADDPEEGMKWGERRRVRAEVLRALLLGAVRPVAGSVPKLQLAGALIEGILDVRGGNIECVAALTNCYFTDELQLADARARTIDLSGSTLSLLDVTSARIDGDLVLDDCHIKNVECSSTRITATLSLAGAHLAAPYGVAFNGDALTVDGYIMCDERLQVEGAIRFPGARIGGEVILNGACIRNPGGQVLNCERASVGGGFYCRKLDTEGETNLLGANIGSQLVFSGARLSNQFGMALAADTVTAGAGIFCHEGFQAKGEVRLLGARVNGQLILNDASLFNPGGTALLADGITVTSDMFCTGKFQASGIFRLASAHIAGNLGLSGAHFINPGAGAFIADRATIGGDVLFEGSRVEGTVVLLGARVASKLSFRGSSVKEPDGEAILSDWLIVDGGVFLDDNFRAEGEVRFPGSRIAGPLELNSASLKNPNGYALIADRMTVNGDVSCSDRFRADGCVSFSDTQIIGGLSFRDAVLTNPNSCALDCGRLQADLVRFSRTTINSVINFTSAQVKTIYSSRWSGIVLIDGFTYDDLRPYAGANGPTGRLSWLAHGEDTYRAQPYEQLASYYRRLGHDKEARRVLVAKQRRRRSELGTVSKISGYAQDWIVGYGYRPGLALAWLIVLVFLGSLYFTMNRPPQVNLLSIFTINLCSTLWT